MLGIRVVTLITAFGIALVKAYLVAKNFMHLDIEKAIVKWLLALALVIMVLLYTLVAPDVEKSKGQHWVKSQDFHYVSEAAKGKRHGHEQQEPKKETEHGPNTVELHLVAPRAPALREQRSPRNGAVRLHRGHVLRGFVSAFAVVESGSPPGSWPPPGQPRLPVAQTALNTLALLASGAALYMAGRRFRVARPGSAERWMGAALALGAFFVVAQGVEWVRLLKQG
jgi:hypothetical protein